MQPQSFTLPGDEGTMPGTPALEIAEPQKPEEDPANFKQFQVDLKTTMGNHLIASSDTVNDLVDQAKYWLGSTDMGMQMNDGQMVSVTLQELDPATGAYVDGEALPVEDKKDILAQIRTMGAR